MQTLCIMHYALCKHYENKLHLQQNTVSQTPKILHHPGWCGCWHFPSPIAWHCLTVLCSLPPDASDAHTVHCQGRMISAGAGDQFRGWRSVQGQGITWICRATQITGSCGSTSGTTGKGIITIWQPRVPPPDQCKINTMQCSFFYFFYYIPY